MKARKPPKRVKDTLAVAESAPVTRQVMEEMLGPIIQHLAQRVAEQLTLQREQLNVLTTQVREFGLESRGVLLEFAKFKQLHRVEAELAWLNGMHGRQAMAEFKEAVGMTKWEGLMREQIKGLEAKQKQHIGLPEGVAYAAQYTWFCDQCLGGVHGPNYASQEEATEARKAHVQEKHPEATEGALVEMRS